MIRGTLSSLAAIVALWCIMTMTMTASAFVAPTTSINQQQTRVVSSSQLFIFSNNKKKQAPASDEEIFGKKGRISDKRRKQLGIADNEDEYDLGLALQANTDDTISKIVAGSFIIAMIALLVAGIVIPATTDYGDGVCNALARGGRC